ncbi:MAG: hypothetical protein M3N50_01600 [Pseudomonadota bacterium]|nr:hypothetical protein [Pseudomonadota bacterium]
MMGIYIADTDMLEEPEDWSSRTWEEPMIRIRWKRVAITVALIVGLTSVWLAG